MCVILVDGHVHMPLKFMHTWSYPKRKNLRLNKKAPFPSSGTIKKKESSPFFLFSHFYLKMEDEIIQKIYKLTTELASQQQNNQDLASGLTNQLTELKVKYI